jgi:peptide/nickel transport system substrate-binding protein
MVERLIGAVATALLGLAMVGTVAGAGTPSASRSTADLRYMVNSDTATWDPAAANGVQNWGGTTGLLGSAVYDNLVTFDQTSGRLVPRLALAVTPNDAATVWTIKLRPGVTFTDGTPFDAAAVKFNWDRYAAPGSTAPVKASLAGFQSWTVVNPTTLQVTMAAPVGGFPATLANSALGEIASPTAIQKFGARYGTAVDAVVGAGPWTLGEWVRADHVTFTRNARYWDSPQPYARTMTLKFVLDDNQKVNILQTGQADMVYVPILGGGTKTLKDAGYPGYGSLTGSMITANFSTQSAPLDDVRIRRALVLAADLEGMNQKAAVGTATVATTWYPKVSPYYEASVRQPTYRLAAAQKLVDAYVAEHGGVAPTVSLYYTTSLKAWGDALLQSWSQLTKINVKADFEAVPTGKAVRGQCQVCMSSSVGGLPPAEPESFFQFYGTGQTANVMKYSDPVLDPILEKSRSAVTQAEKKPYLDKITKRVLEQSYQLLIYRNVNYTFTAKDVQGVAMKDASFPQPAGIYVAGRK